jgi:hypothetical protein
VDIGTNHEHEKGSHPESCSIEATKPRILGDWKSGLDSGRYQDSNNGLSELGIQHMLRELCLNSPSGCFQSSTRMKVELVEQMHGG